MTAWICCDCGLEVQNKNHYQSRLCSVVALTRRLYRDGLAAFPIGNSLPLWLPTRYEEQTWGVYGFEFGAVIPYRSEPESVPQLYPLRPARQEWAPAWVRAVTDIIGGADGVLQFEQTQSRWQAESVRNRFLALGLADYRVAQQVVPTLRLGGADALHALVRVQLNRAAETHLFDPAMVVRSVRRSRLAEWRKSA